MGLFSNLFKPASTVLVVDVAALNESLGMKGNVAPRNQLQTLRRLSRFSNREKIEVVAVVPGAPLNKAPNGKKFEGIQVLYATDTNKVPAFVAKTTNSKGSGAIMVTGGDAAEKLVGASVGKLRMSTFRKAFDLGGDQDSSSDRNSSRGSRPPRRNRQRSNNNQQNNESRKERAPKPPREKAPSQSDAINELIDLVD